VLLFLLRRVALRAMLSFPVGRAARLEPYSPVSTTRARPLCRATPNNILTPTLSHREREQKKGAPRGALVLPMMMVPVEKFERGGSTDHLGFGVLGFLDAMADQVVDLFVVREFADRQAFGGALA
jgi:hypothetical protein